VTTAAVTWTGGDRQVPRRLFLPMSAVPLIATCALLMTAALYSLYRDDSPWLALALVVFMFIAAQALVASAHAPWVPGLIVVTAAIQWVFAPWAGYHVLPTFPLYGMVLEAPDYFSFAVPVTLALTAGLYLPMALMRIGSTRDAAQRPAPAAASRGLRRTCDAMVVVGALISVFLLPRLPTNIRYAALLVGDLSCVGALTLCLMRAPGWWMRVAVVLVAQLVLASVDGVFHDLLLWVVYTMLIIVYRDRLRARVLVGLILIGVYAVATLNGIKMDYRRELEQTVEPTAGQRLQMLGDAVGAPILHPGDVFSEDHIRYGVTRLNQGWIISRILRRVPTAEPYADGETLVTALENAAVPRVLRPNKYVAGGNAYFERFTGVSMFGASMNLGLSGEMYANFGRAGAWIAVFAWGSLVGLLFVGFVRAARRSPLWWAWAPYVMLYTAQAENGVGEVVNQVSKSILVMLVVITVLPAWRELRPWRWPRLVTARFVHPGI
jgi:hypothetical protein